MTQITDEQLNRLPKWAREYVGATERSLRIAKALRFTDAVEPDVLPPETSGELRKGWSFNSHSGTVSKSCTDSNAHSTWGDHKTVSQGSRRLFSSRLLALKAMRHELEMIYAAKLAEVDGQIQKEKGNAP